jgi:hypothetical protein
MVDRKRENVWGEWRIQHRAAKVRGHVWRPEMNKCPFERRIGIHRIGKEEECERQWAFSEHEHPHARAVSSVVKKVNRKGYVGAIRIELDEEGARQREHTRRKSWWAIKWGTTQQRASCARGHSG